VRIFMEGQEEWFEPGGEAMVVLAKMLAVGAFIALLWGAFIRFTGHQTTGKAAWPSGQFIAAMAFSLLSLTFYLGGKLGIFAGRKMRERGMKLP
jgi:hypothetical protein